MGLITIINLPIQALELVASDKGHPSCFSILSGDQIRGTQGSKQVKLYDLRDRSAESRPGVSVDPATLNRVREFLDHCCGVLTGRVTIYPAELIASEGYQRFLSRRGLNGLTVLKPQEQQALVEGYLAEQLRAWDLSPVDSQGIGDLRSSGLQTIHLFRDLEKFGFVLSLNHPTVDMRAQSSSNFTRMLERFFQRLPLRSTISQIEAASLRAKHEHLLKFVQFHFLRKAKANSEDEPILDPRSQLRFLGIVESDFYSEAIGALSSVAAELVPLPSGVLNPARYWVSPNENDVNYRALQSREELNRANQINTLYVERSGAFVLPNIDWLSDFFQVAATHFPDLLQKFIDSRAFRLNGPRGVTDISNLYVMTDIDWANSGRAKTIRTLITSGISDSLFSGMRRVILTPEDATTLLIEAMKHKLMHLYLTNKIMYDLIIQAFQKNIDNPEDRSATNRMIAVFGELYSDLGLPPSGLRVQIPGWIPPSQYTHSHIYR